jgi:hypothetical protein
VSSVPVILDYDEGEESRLEQLLAVHQMWRGLERVAATIHAHRDAAAMAVSRTQLTRELQELIAALDRRVPQLERADETAIARDAADLRAQAMKRLAEIVDETTASAVPART